MFEKKTSPSVSKDSWKTFTVNPVVFFTSAAIIILFVTFSISFHKSLGDWFGTLQSNIANYGGWFFIWTMNIALIFSLVLLFGRFGDVRLGGDDAEPEFSTPAWFAMLFSAGMGIGLLFYGVAEPMFHYMASPFAKPETPEAARLAMDLTFLHWGFHPWALYTIVGLCLAFFSFNKGYPLTIRTVLVPLIGDRVNGPLGYAVDIMATVATLFGVATSLGLGVQQVNAGLHHVFGVPQTNLVQLLLIVCITGIATTSVMKGLDAGIRRLSEINMIIALLLMFFVLAVGPTLFILNGLIENVGFYIQKLPQLSTWAETYENTSWQNGWTVFYWGWWIAWSPFVGMFIARVSKGRTIRQFILGVMLIPAFVTFVWITVFGNSALYIDMFGSGGIGQAVQDNIPVSLFVLLEKFPLSDITCVLGICVVVTFFVTSSDSGSMVIDIITADGNPDPPPLQRLFWAVSEGVVAAALLMGGGLVALQTAAITTGLPFAIVILLMCVSLYKGLSEYVGPQRFRIERRSRKRVLLKTKASPKTIARLTKSKLG